MKPHQPSFIWFWTNSVELSEHGHTLKAVKKKQQCRKLKLKLDQTGHFSFSPQRQSAKGNDRKIKTDQIFIFLNDKGTEGTRGAEPATWAAATPRNLQHKRDAQLHRGRRRLRGNGTESAPGLQGPHRSSGDVCVENVWVYSDKLRIKTPIFVLNGTTTNNVWDHWISTNN